MKRTTTLFLTALTGALFCPALAQAASLESAPPVVVRTVPVAGAVDVDPGLTEIQATFSKPMRDKGWAWCYEQKDQYPQTTGQPRYLPDGRTCVLPVKLEPGKFYAIWLNHGEFQSFQDQNQVPAVPYLLSFQTAGAGEPGKTGEAETQEPVEVPAPEPLPGLAQATVLQHDTGIKIGMESISASGHAVLFTRPPETRYVEAVQIFASRYGMPEAPMENFHLYLLNDQQQLLADVPFPYSMIKRGDMKWYTLRTPSIEVPEQFIVALNFNPHRTKGIYLAYSATNGPVCCSLIGLPGEGFEPWKPVEWMVRVTLTSEPTKALGFQSLADWKPPAAQDPFTRCQVAAFGGEQSENQQSYSGSGPAIRFKPNEFLPGAAAGGPLTLKGLRLYASRYGSGYPLEETMLQVQVLDAQGARLGEAAFPYAKFSYRVGWVDLVFDPPVQVPQPDQLLTIALDPQATRFKGIYFHYQKDPPASHSLVGTVSDGFRTLPDREWLLQACFQ